ncbi:MBL fold metallo-hydrolase [Phaeobacter sp. QD34_3]|uniref:MBL fold metallo-hydrolase n=1 Tax=unclassified Phaeobacter TaxID=2621772 RepID=UPI00237F123F|nr:MULTISPECIES: MBL fold metallo-hydrolase [unclassified Phaeobacter]MDE4133918.1 MBL fold metallo-hydrolase [Phaeobacter sp. QD34_3]MDE4137625.1 MBL fold metallo-hydrolase [Phaeobacter sp. QD34_24]
MMSLVLTAVPIMSVADVLERQQVTEDVWALVGPHSQRNAENLGNNATFGVVVTREGVVLMDPGGSWKGAAMIDAAIDQITDQPVTHVIDTGGQDHRWLGNAYWQAQGAVVIASDAAVADHKDRQSMQMTMLSQLLGDELAGTEPSYADVTFDSDHEFSLGGLTFQIMHRGQAHTPGDSFVWLQERDVMFTGDIVYVERILGVGPQSNAKSWIEAFDAMAAFEPAHLVPGHGRATTLERARADTYDYLMNLRARIGELIEEGGDIMEAPEIDQSAFAGLAQFDSLAGRNAQTVYEQMEWE